MITKVELLDLLHSTETYRIERTVSIGDMDKFQEAICAFSNDLPNSKKNGYLILGAYDNGTLSGLKVDDDLLKKISGYVRMVIYCLFLLCRLRDLNMREEICSLLRYRHHWCLL